MTKNQIEQQAGNCFPELKISILGCGWLGQALAKRFVSLGAKVKGSVRYPDQLPFVEATGAQSFLVEMAPEFTEESELDFFNADLLIVCFPPKRREDIATYYPHQVASIVRKIKEYSIKKVLFVSSTSVYPSTQSIVDENCMLAPDKPSGVALIDAETLLTNEQSFSTTVVRFGGLIGYDRNPGRFLQGKKNFKSGNVPVNLIHQDDCVGIIEQLIAKGIDTNCFNACSPEHPSREEFYCMAAKKAGFDAPIFDNEEKPKYKIISTQKIVDALNYKFIYPNPLDTI